MGHWRVCVMGNGRVWVVGVPRGGTAWTGYTGQGAVGALGVVWTVGAGIAIGVERNVVGHVRLGYLLVWKEGVAGCKL